MNATAIRRYLQPSPTLRWHPWAPLVAGLLLIVFVFYLGAMWGFAAHGRLTSQLVYSEAAQTRFQIEREAKSPAKAAYWESRRFDDAVIRWVKDTPAQPSAWRDVRDRIEAVAFWNGRQWPAVRKQDVRKLAEYRLENLAGAAPRWQRSATFCQEFGAPLSGEDVRETYRRAAAAYSVVLDRSVAPEELAPAVPGFRCEWQGPNKF